MNHDAMGTGAPALPRPATKPFAGFVVVLALAAAVGAWLYMDHAAKELASREAGAPAAAPEPPAIAPETEPAPRRTYAAALGEHRFQVDLPEGWELRFAEDGMGDLRAYLVASATSGNEAPVPDAVVNVVSLSNPSYAEMLGKPDEPMARLVPVPDGRYAFWLRTWEGSDWPAFGAVAASFKAL
jgi:hypothetical protein